MCKSTVQKFFNPLNAELNPICHLLALLGAHHILHVCRIRVKFILIFHLHCMIRRIRKCQTFLVLEKFNKTKQYVGVHVGAVG
jgi:hypothetical protein